MSEINKFALFIAVFSFIVFNITSPGETPYNYFSLLAYSFTQYSTTLAEAPSHLNELIPAENGRFYVPYAPMPAILLFIPSLVFQEVVSQSFYARLLGSLITYFSIINSYLLTKNLKTAIYVGFITAFGSGIWFLSSVGSSWYIGQLSGILFLTIAIYLKLKKHSLILIGLCVGAAYLSRPHLILSLPFFILYDRLSIKGVFKILIGFAPAFIFNSWYNYIRFETISNNSYKLIPGVLNEPWYTQGIFHYSYIPKQLSVMLFEFPLIQNNFPFFVPELRGMAFWIMFPAVFVIPYCIWNYKNILTAIFSIILLLPILMHGGTGFTQFGYRYGLDIAPLLIMLISNATTRINQKFTLMIVITSIIINTWGVLMINLFNRYVI